MTADSSGTYVAGIGGYFVRAKDPDGLLAWYRDVMGIPIDEHGLWQQAAGPTVFAPFPADSDYFPTRQQSMLNLRVPDLDALLHRLRSVGADVAADTEEMAGVGRFGWVTDPEGNRIELWEPAP